MTMIILAIRSQYKPRGPTNSVRRDQRCGIYAILSVECEYAGANAIILYLIDSRVGIS